MFPVEILPTVNAILNASAATLILIGRILIKRGEVAMHKAVMISAVSVSALFLISYLTYHTIHGSQPFQAQGFIRVVYFSILLSHTVLAAAVLPMVLITLRRGLLRNDAMHKAIARWTYPVWTYVSVTGVVIYLMLYHFYAPGS